MSRSSNWVFTLNNYLDDEISQIDSLFRDEKAVYLCYQKETAPTTGTPHLQGYISCPGRVRLSGLKKLLGPRASCLLANGSPSACRTYCSKKESSVPGSFKEFGVLPEDPKKLQGKRNDFAPFLEAVAGGLRCKRQARIDFPQLVAKYPRWCYDILSDQREIQVESHELHEWQKDLEKCLLEEPTDREIIFIVDKEGCQGKTWFAKHYCNVHEDAQFMEPGKKADMAYALQDNLRVLFLNVTRSTDPASQNYLYSFMESVKDGMVFSPKYESRMKYFGNVHVVVMMNEEPNQSLLSKDRYAITKLN